MVDQGIILGYVISSKGIEVDKFKVDIVRNLPPPTTVKEDQSFLIHPSINRRFIQDFPKIAKLLCTLLQKDILFVFDKKCKEAFKKLKDLLTTTPIIHALGYSHSFELIHDASDHTVGVVLGKRIEKQPYVIYYAFTTLNDAQLNYFTIDNELMVFIFNSKKIRLYLIGTKVVVFSNHKLLCIY